MEDVRGRAIANVPALTAALIGIVALGAVLCARFADVSMPWRNDSEGAQECSEFLGFHADELECAIGSLEYADAPNEGDRYMSFMTQYDMFIGSFIYIEDDTDEVRPGATIIERNFGDCLDIAIAAAAIARRHGIEPILVFGESLIEPKVGHVWMAIIADNEYEGWFRGRDNITVLRDTEGIHVFFNPLASVEAYRVIAYYMLGRFYPVSEVENDRVRQ